MTPERLVEIRRRADDVICGPPGRWVIGGSGSHWAECWRSHADCMASWLGVDASDLLVEVERLKGELAERDEALRELSRKFTLAEEDARILERAATAKWPPDHWWHELHGLHDEAHHQHHDPMHLCVPLNDACPPVTRKGNHDE